MFSRRPRFVNTDLRPERVVERKHHTKLLTDGSLRERVGSIVVGDVAQHPRLVHGLEAFTRVREHLLEFKDDCTRSGVPRQNLPRLLRVGGERGGEQTKGEGGDELDDGERHDHPAKPLQTSPRSRAACSPPAIIMGRPTCLPNDSDHRACANDLTICFHPKRTLRCIALFGVLNARQRTVYVVVETYLPSGAIPTRRSVLPSRSP